MPRIFTALTIPPAIAQELSFKQFGIEGARWINQEDFHITLRFIGDVDKHTADILHEKFSQITFPDFSVQLSSIGSFGKRKPRSLWAGVRSNSELFALNNRLEDICQNCGLEPETRNYTPHVTLARLKGTKPSDVEYYKESQSLYKSDIFNVDKFCLLSSKPSTGGGPYVTLETYKLGL